MFGAPMLMSDSLLLIFVWQVPRKTIDAFTAEDNRKLLTNSMCDW